MLRSIVLAGVVALALGGSASAQPQAGRFYYIEHKFSGKNICSGKENLAKIWLWGPIPNGHEPAYKFKLIASGEADTYYLQHAQSGKYMCSSGNENGVDVWLYGPIPSGHEPSYKFQLVNLDNGQYYLIHKRSGKYLCCGGRDNGNRLNLWGPIPDGHEERYKFSFTEAN
jgi:hypothetical protein